MDNFVLGSGTYIATGIILGFAAGWLFYRLWRWLLPRSQSHDFWRTLPASARAMLNSDEPSEIFRHYRTLITAIARFVVRNTLSLIVGIAPVAAIFLLLYALDPSGRVATSIEIHPAAAISAQPALLKIGHTIEENLLIDREKLNGGTINLAGLPLDAKTLGKKQAFCESTVSCLLFDMMMFATHRIRSPAKIKSTGSVVVRPLHLSNNPFWPYLNDLDFWFFIAVMAGSAVAAWKRRPRRTNAS